VLRDGVAFLAPAGCTEAKVVAMATTAAAAKMQNDVRNMCLSFDVQDIPDGRPERDLPHSFAGRHQVTTCAPGALFPGEHVRAPCSLGNGAAQIFSSCESLDRSNLRPLRALRPVTREARKTARDARLRPCGRA
jgi:hypothetical protein